MLRSKKFTAPRPKGITQRAVENEIKKKRGGNPKGLKPKKDHEIRAPKPMKERKKKKKRDPNQKMEEEPT